MDSVINTNAVEKYSQHWRNITSSMKCENAVLNSFYSKDILEDGGISVGSLYDMNSWRVVDEAKYTLFLLKWG